MPIPPVGEIHCPTGEICAERRSDKCLQCERLQVAVSGSIDSPDRLPWPGNGDVRIAADLHGIRGLKFCVSADVHCLPIERAVKQTQCAVMDYSGCLPMCGIKPPAVGRDQGGRVELRALDPHTQPRWQ